MKRITYEKALKELQGVIEDQARTIESLKIEGHIKVSLQETIASLSYENERLVNRNNALQSALVFINDARDHWMRLAFKKKLEGKMENTKASFKFVKGDWIALAEDKK